MSNTEVQGVPRPLARYQGSDSTNELYHPFQPRPDLATGELKIDPEIMLRAQGLDLAISFFYSAKSTTNDQYGRARSASVGAYVLSSTSTVNITIVRGDMRQTLYRRDGSGNYYGPMDTSNVGVYNSLTFDGTKFTETFPDGAQMVYQAQVGGGNPVKHELIKVADASGNTQTYTYGTPPEAGLLKTITVPGGNKVTFTYCGFDRNKPAVNRRRLGRAQDNVPI
ncbi:MAG: hypothetical protein QM758_13115 [Armatimonas sp.]